MARMVVVLACGTVCRSTAIFARLSGHFSDRGRESVRLAASLQAHLRRSANGVNLCSTPNDSASPILVLQYDARVSARD